MKTIISIFLSLSFLTSCAQEERKDDVSEKTNFELSDSTKTLVRELARVNQVMSSAVYYAGIRPEQYDTFSRLRSTATTEELVILTNHKNGTVRCYAFWALTDRDEVDHFNIAKAHIDDTETVSTQFGCISSETYVGDFFIDLVTPRYIGSEKGKLDSAQMRLLDFQLISSNNRLEATSSALARVQPSDSLYPRIRELAKNNKHPNAIVALARHNKNQDLNIIKSHRAKPRHEEDGYFYTYAAIVEFPSESFMPFLKKQLDRTFDNTHFSNEWRNLYSAIASYKSNWSIEQLQRPLTEVKHNNIRKYHLDFVYEALIEQVDTTYTELYWLFWDKENRLSPEVFNFLSNVDNVRSQQLAEKTLRNPEKLDVITNRGSFAFDTESSTNLISIMLTELMSRNQATGLELLIKGIKTSNVHDFPVFADVAEVHRNDKVVDALMNRISSEWNAHVYLKAAKVLLSFSDDEINERLLAVRLENKELRKDWGGASLTELLKEHGLE